MRARLQRWWQFHTRKRLVVRRHMGVWMMLECRGNRVLRSVSSLSVDYDLKGKVYPGFFLPVAMAPAYRTNWLKQRILLTIAEQNQQLTLSPKWR